MNKKTTICVAVAILIIATIAAIVFIIFINKPKVKQNTNQEAENKISSRENINDITIENTSDTDNKKALNQEQLKEEEVKGDMIKIKVNNNVLEVELEDNEATKVLKDRLKNGNIVVRADEYGGFEKVGNLGFSLPRNDINISTNAGDIVLYQGNQISLFYNSSSWSYTKLGKVQNVSPDELKSILGTGSVTLVLSLD